MAKTPPAPAVRYWVWADCLFNHKPVTKECQRQGLHVVDADDYSHDLAAVREQLVQEQAVSKRLLDESHADFETTERLLKAADARCGELIEQLKQAREFVEMASCADNSGGEYNPTCQQCNGINHHHMKGCALDKWLTGNTPTEDGHE